MAKRKKKIFYARGWSPSGEGFVEVRIRPSDAGFYRIRGFSIVKKVM
jgi:hypothetical protein